jgi:GTPase
MVPVFLVSSVSGRNLDLLRKFLNLLTPDVPGDELCAMPAFLQVGFNSDSILFWVVQ